MRPFEKLKVELPNVDHPNPVLKVKVDTGAQGSVPPLRIFKSMFPDHINKNGLPTATTPSQTKLTAYNSTHMPQHGVCSIKCSYGDKKTYAMLNVADVAGLASYGLPTSCELCYWYYIVQSVPAGTRCLSQQLRIRVTFSCCALIALVESANLKGEYLMVTDPDVPPVVNAPRKCAIQH